MADSKPTLRVRTAGDILDLDIPTRQPMLGSWLTDRHLCMVFAEAGLGKSMLVLACALAIAGGGKLFGRWAAVRPQRVLIVDGEMDNVDLQERLRLIMPTIEGLDRKAALGNLRFMSRL